MKDFWSSALPMLNTDLKPEEKERLKENMLGFLKEMVKKARFVQSEMEDAIKIPFEGFRALVCYTPMPYDVKDSILFCLGKTSFDGHKTGTIGGVLRTVGGIYRASIPCPHYGKKECPLFMAEERERKASTVSVDF